jgi:Uma2 family endonuclease
VDAAFFTTDQRPVRHTPEGYALTVPALVAEVVVRSDDELEVSERVERHLAAGVRLVWVPDEPRRQVRVYQPGKEPQVLTEEDNLTAEGIIPNLSFPIRRLFEGLEDGS